MSLISRVKSFFNRDNLGGYGDQTWVPHAFDWNFWQEDRHLESCGRNTAVEACVSAISQTIAMMPLQHWRIDADGGRERMNSAASRVLRRPNGYQTQTDFILNLIRSELLTGNGYAYVIRNNRNEITAMHLVPYASAQPYIDPETQQVFYSVSGNPMIYTDDGVMIPARDILHIRSTTPVHPLIGETPLVAAGMAAAAGNAVQAHNAAFIHNMSTPSGVLELDKNIDENQMQQLRAMWDKQTKGKNSGGTPIASGGLKWHPMTVSAVDSEMIALYKLTVEDIARVFRVPPPVIGMMEFSTFNNVESMMKSWISTGLGYTIRHIEESLDRLFDLPPNQEVMFDTDVLLRSDFAARVEGLVKGITGGLYSPNEARMKEGLSAVDGGEEPRMQMQNQPLSQINGPEPEAPPAMEPEALPTEDEKILIAADTLRRAMH